MLGFGSEMSSPEVHGFEHLVPAVGECCGILGGGVLPEQVAGQRQALRSILCFLAVEKMWPARHPAPGPMPSLPRWTTYHQRYCHYKASKPFLPQVSSFQVHYHSNGKVTNILSISIRAMVPSCGCTLGSLRDLLKILSLELHLNWIWVPGSEDLMDMGLFSDRGWKPSYKGNWKRQNKSQNSSPHWLFRDRGSNSLIIPKANLR